MPYCNQCGTQSNPADRFCAKCGAPQPVTAGEPGVGSTASPGSTAAGAASAGAAAATDFLSSIEPKTASLLCYIPVVGWIWAIVVLASTRFRHIMDVRFNAFQGLYLFVAWLIVDWVLSPMLYFPHEYGLRFIPKLLKLTLIGAWILMIVKTAHGENYRLPIVGELADRSVSEQR